MTPAHLARLAERARSAAIDAAHWSMYANGRTQLNEEDREAGALEYARVMNQANQEEAA